MTKMLNAPNLPEGIANANTLTPDKIEEAYTAGTPPSSNPKSHTFSTSRNSKSISPGLLEHGVAG